MPINWSTTSLIFSLLHQPLLLLWFHDVNTSQLSILQVNYSIHFYVGHPIATPEKAVEALSESHLAYLEECEIACCPSNEKTPCLIEISPLVSIRDEGLDKLKEIQLSLPCSVYDRSEVELTTENHRMLTDTVAILNEKENTRFVYVV